MADCRQCGKQISDDASFCPACGAIVTTPQTEAGGEQLPPQAPEPGAQPPAPPQTPPPGQPYQSPAGVQQPYQPGAFPPPPPAKQKTGKTWKIVLVVALVVALVIVGAVAAIGLFVFSAVKAPIDATNEFIEAVNKGDANTAWDMLHPSSSFRQDYTQSTFETEVVDTLAGELSTWNANEASVSGSEAQVEVDVSYKDGSEDRVTFNLEKSNDDWLILNWF